ncbi:MAG: hypothetical protein KME13_15715 [Myxacorys californica WJT36-NPBG1]|jgi:hypothetical protein|nr:hypothetical protein [Myxacorys californica WJT36-NPBG1]
MSDWSSDRLIYLIRTPKPKRLILPPLLETLKRFPRFDIHSHFLSTYLF